MTVSTRVPEIAAHDLALAERSATRAQGQYQDHERYCSLWTRDLTCPTCAQLWELAEGARRFRESLIRQQTAAGA